MKKLVVAATAVAMMMAMSVTAFAAGSPGSEGTMDTIYGNEITDGDFTIMVHPDAEVTVETYEPAKREEIAASLEEAKKNDAALREEIKKLGLDPDKASVEGIYNVTSKDGGKATFAFVAGSKLGVGEKWVALHQKADGTWEAVEVKENPEGGYYIELDSFSPVAFLWGAEIAAQAGTTEEAKKDENTSPKTGDLGAVALIKAVF